LVAFDLEAVRQIAERVAGSVGVELVDLEFRGGTGKQGRVLRLTIDRQPEPGAGTTDEVGVTHEDCANVSREVSTILDVEEVVPGGEYVLEVSSPGLDRKLSSAKDYERFVGSRVRLMTREPVGVSEKSKGNRHFEGKLASFADGKLTIDLAAPKKHQKPKGKHADVPQLLEIALSNVERANLVPEI
jgi:ribosome maturation factor RimP